MVRIFIKYLNWIAKGRLGPGATDEELAGWCLKHKYTFGLPTAELNDPLIGFKCLLRSFKRGNADFLPKVIDGANSDAAMLDVNYRHLETRRLPHVKTNTGLVPKLVVGRQGLPLLMKPLDWLLLMFGIGPVVAIYTLFSSTKGSTAVLIYEVMEMHLILRLFKQHGIRQVFFYCSYEKDANAMYLVLKQRGIRVTKMPSPSLLSIHHKVLLTDVLGLGSPYQLDEIKLLTEQDGSFVRCTELEQWTPEAYSQYGHLYSETPDPPVNSVGYYSHGSWVRAEMGHDDELGDHSAELAMLQLLPQVLKENNINSITLFLHPKEKRHKTMEQMKAYYAGYFQGFEIVIGNPDRGSTELFHRVDIGVGALSTILFERMFCGFKTVFFPVEKMDFPIPQSPVTKVCPMTKEQLALVMDDLLKNPQPAHYWDTLGMSRYRSESWLAK